MRTKGARGDDGDDGGGGGGGAVGAHGHVPRLGRSLRRGDAVTYFDRERNAFPARVASAGGAETYDEAMRPSYVVAVRRTTDASRLYRIPAG